MFDVNVPTEHRAVTDDDVVRDEAVVGNVNTAHKVTVAADGGNALLFFRSTIDRDAFANRIAIADYDFSVGASVADVLRSAPDYGPGGNNVVFADRDVAKDRDAVDQLGPAADFGLGSNDTEWTDFNSRSDLS